MGKGSLFWFGRDPSLYFNYAQALSLDRGPRLKDMEHSYTVHIDNKIPYDVARVKLINQLFDIIFQHGNIKEPMWRDKDILHLYTLEGGNIGSTGDNYQETP